MLDLDELKTFIRWMFGVEEPPKPIYIPVEEKRPPNRD